MARYILLGRKTSGVLIFCATMPTLCETGNRIKAAPRPDAVACASGFAMTRQDPVVKPTTG